MSTVAIGPSAIADGGNWTTVGGGTVLGNIGDLSDTTGITPPTGDDPQGTVIVAMTAAAIPAYGRVTSVEVSARWKGNGGQISIAMYTTTSTGIPVTWGEVPPASATTRTFSPVTVAPDGSAWTGANLAQLTIQVWGTGDVTLLELGAVANVDEAPSVTVLAPLGSVSADDPLTARWSANDPEGRQPERTQVRLYPMSQVGLGFTPDLSMAIRSFNLVGSATTTPLGALAPDSYRLAVRVSEVGSFGRYGGWGYADFELVGAAAGSPALAVAVDRLNRRVALTADRRDNALTWEQAGGGDGTVPTGWYADVNCAAPGTANPVASGTEGGKVITMTSLAAGAVSMRSGGPWSTGAAPVVTGQVVLDGAATPPRASTVPYGGGSVTSTGTYQAGMVLVALASAGSSLTGTSNGPSLSSVPALGWSAPVSSGASGSKDEAVGWYAVIPPGGSGTYATTLACSINDLSKTFQIVAFDGVDPASPMIAFGSGAGSPSVSQSATVAGALMAVGFAEYYDRATPAVAPGQLISAAKVGTVGASAISAAAGSPSSTLQVAVTTPTSGVSWSWVWFVLRPAATPPPVIIEQSGNLVGFPIQPFRDYVGVGSAWQSANAARHARVDARCYGADGTLLSTTVGTAGALSTSSVMTDLPPTPFTAPAGSAVGILVPVATDAAAGSEVFHWDKLGALPAGARWSRGGTMVTNLMGPVDALQSAGTTGTWGSFSCSLAAVAASTLSGYVLRLKNGGAGGIVAGPTPVAIPAGTTVISAGCLMSVTDAAITGCWLSLRFIDAAGGTISWPGGTLINPPTAGRAPAVIAGVAVPDGAVSVQITPASVSAISTIQGLDCTLFGIWAAPTVPAAYQVGPTARSFPLLEFSDDDGATWNTVRATDAAPYDASTGAAVVYDYEICPGVQREYRASTMVVDYRADTAGVVSMSAPTSSLPAWIPPKDWWLSDPQSPGTAITVQVAGDLAYGITAHSARFDVVSDPATPNVPVLPVVTFDGRSGLDQDVSLIVRGDADWRALRRMLQSGQTLLLQGDMGEQWYVQLGDVAGTLYSSVSRLMDPTRSLSAHATQVARPPVVLL